MNSEISQKSSYDREYLAQVLEWVNADIQRCPERYKYMTPAEREMWAGFPAQVRAHRYPWVRLDPERPIVDYLKSGRIGPDFQPNRDAKK